MTETVHTAITARLAELGIPNRIDTDSYSSIVALFEEALRPIALRRPAAVWGTPSATLSLIGYLPNLPGGCNMVQALTRVTALPFKCPI